MDNNIYLVYPLPNPLFTNGTFYSTAGFKKKNKMLIVYLMFWSQLFKYFFLILNKIQVLCCFMTKALWKSPVSPLDIPPKPHNPIHSLIELYNYPRSHCNISCLPAVCNCMNSYSSSAQVSPYSIYLWLCSWLSFTEWINTPYKLMYVQKQVLSSSSLKYGKLKALLQDLDDKA